MQVGRKAAVKRGAAQKGAQYKGTSGRGRPWYAGQNHYYTRGPTADCTQAHSLIEGLDADNLLADRGY